MGRWVGTDLEPTFQFKEKYGSKTARLVCMFGKTKIDLGGPKPEEYVRGFLKRLYLHML